MQLPVTYSSKDERWLKEQFETLEALTGIKNAQAVAAKYSAAYNEVFDSVEETHKRENKARFEANTRLRTLIKKLQEKPIKPHA